MVGGRAAQVLAAGSRGHADRQPVGGDQPAQRCPRGQRAVTIDDCDLTTAAIRLGIPRVSAQSALIRAGRACKRTDRDDEFRSLVGQTARTSGWCRPKAPEHQNQSVSQRQR